MGGAREDHYLSSSTPSLIPGSASGTGRAPETGGREGSSGAGAREEAAGLVHSPLAGVEAGSAQRGAPDSLARQALAARAVALLRAQAQAHGRSSQSNSLSQSHCQSFHSPASSLLGGASLPSPPSDGRSLPGLASAPLASSLLQRMQQQMQSGTQSHLQPHSLFQPQPDSQAQSLSQLLLGGDLPSALAQLFQGHMSQQAYLNQQAPLHQQGSLSQQEQLRQAFLGQAPASVPLARSSSPSLVRDAPATAAPLSAPFASKAPGAGAGAGAGRHAGSSSSSSSSPAAALAELLATNPSLQALLQALEPHEAGDSLHGASYAAEQRGGALAPSAHAQGEGGGLLRASGGGPSPLEAFNMPSLPELGQGSAPGGLPDMRMLSEEPLGALPSRQLQDTLEGAVLGMLDPALEGQGRERCFSPVPGGGGAQGQGEAAYSAHRTGALAHPPAQKGTLPALQSPESADRGAGEVGRQGQAHPHRQGLPAIDVAPPDGAPEAILSGENSQLLQREAGAWQQSLATGGAGAGHGSRISEGAGAGMEKISPRGPRPQGLPVKQERSSGVRASQAEELEGGESDDLGTPTEGRLSTKSIVEKRRRERISNAFTDLRKEMDLHGDMATVLVEATKLVKKQKVLIHNLQKQVYIHQALKSNPRLF